MNRDYYVYLHIRKDNGKCFYVGKGKGNRYKTFKDRSALHKYVCEKCGVTPIIIANGLTNIEACEIERYTIHNLIELGFKLANNGYKLDLNDDFLVNHTYGGEDGYFKSGNKNPMFGVSPKERMDSYTYEKWYKSTHERLNNQCGENNPNYGNDTLKKKLEKNPELKIEYYSRPGSNNGRSRAIKVYDINKNFIKEFDYIGACCEWLKKELNLDSNINSMRSNMSIAAKLGKPYRGYYFELM